MSSSGSSSKRNQSELKLDIINAIGADTNTPYKNPVSYITKNRYILYPVGHHILIRDITTNDPSRHNNINFIYLEKESARVTSLSVSQDKSIFILCEETNVQSSTISLYFLGKINFENVTIYKPKRKIITNKYSNLKSCSFTSEGNLICAIGTEIATKKTKGLIYNVQKFQPFKLNLTTPSVEFDLSDKVEKITFYKRIICTSGNFNINFWSVFENATKEIKNNLSQAKHYIDHSWVDGTKYPTLLAVTTENELFVVEAAFEKGNKLYNKHILDESFYANFDKFIIKQTFVNIFNNNNSFATVVCAITGGVIVGNNIGDLVIFEKLRTKEEMNNQKSSINSNSSRSDESNFSNFYQPLRIIERRKESGVTGISLSLSEDQMVVSYETNEIVYVELNSIFTKLKNKLFDLTFNILSEGFHSGAITAMEISPQRPIILTASNFDKTIRVWNYITGHSEYCKIVFTESNDYKVNDINILSMAMHPNGYYIAISDGEMIWFFHLCYKELRFYGTDRPGPSEQKKSHCSLIKFSNGGHILAVVAGRTIHFLHSISRETIKSIVTEHSQEITDIFFSDMDRYLYTVGRDGYIYQINLFTFSKEKLIAKYVNYTSGSFYSQTDEISSVVACGLVSADKHSITHIDFIPSVIPSEDTVIKKSEITKIADKVDTLCAIKSKKYDIIGIATGTEDGRVILYSHNVDEPKSRWDSIQSHQGRITKMIYNKDTNLLFSSGEDGNVFVYGIYEYIDGENFLFDNRIVNINQLNTVLDEGLGENVLFPLLDLGKIGELEREKKEMTLSFKEKEEVLVKENEKKIKNIESSLTMKKEKEVNELKEKIMTLELKIKETVKQYEERLTRQVEEDRKKFNEQNKLSQERIKSLEEELYEKENDYQLLEQTSQAELTRQGREYQIKFKKLQQDLKSKVREIESQKENLQKNLDDLHKEKEINLIRIDEEHELERNVLLHEQEKKVDDYEFELENQHYEIIRLKDHKKKIEEDLSNKEKDIKVLNDKIDSMQNLISVLKDSIEKKDSEKEKLVNRITEVERMLQEKEKLGAFTNKLKNELYRKNVEITAKYKSAESENEFFISSTKKMEKSINNTVVQVKNVEREKQQLKIMIEGLKSENENMRHKANLIQSNFDDVLLKIYESFQSNNKNQIFRCISEIYRIYLTDDFLHKMNKKKLNVDIREELEKQIDALQNNISQEIKNQDKVDQYQNLYKEKKIEENSSILGNCTRLRMKNNELYKEVKNLKGINRALQKKIFNIKQEMTLPKLTKNNSALNLHSDLGIEENEIINLIKDNYTKNTVENNKNRNSTLDVFNLASQSNNSVITQLNNLSRLRGKKEKLPPGSLMTIRHLK